MSQTIRVLLSPVRLTIGRLSPPLRILVSLVIGLVAGIAAARAAPEAALPAYQVRREARVRRIVEAANANARNYHLSGLRRDLAHAGLRLANRFAPGRVLDRFGWVYDHDVTT